MEILEINKVNVSKFINLNEDVLYEIINTAIGLQNPQACTQLDPTSREQKLIELVSSVLEEKPIQLKKSKLSGFYFKNKFHSYKTQIQQIINKDEFLNADNSVESVTKIALALSELFYPCASMAGATLISRGGIKEYCSTGQEHFKV